MQQLPINQQEKGKVSKGLWCKKYELVNLTRSQK